MRPVNRGPAPRVYAQYGDARGDLIARMGEYCSFCEMPLGASLAVEHMQPKALYPALRLEWTNFLLACTNCNSTKGDQDVVLNRFYWPDRDNTARVFAYSTGGMVAVNASLKTAQRQRAARVVALMGLDRRPGLTGAASDRRWFNRKVAWDMAERALGHIQANDTPQLRETIVDLALAKGFWSVWMTVFRNDANMLERFITAFPGTDAACFDVLTLQPVPRTGGAI